MCVCVAAPSNYGDRQVARSRRDTVHCGAAVRAAICLCKPPPILRNSLGAIWGLYSSSAQSFWLALVRDSLFAQHEDIHCMLKKADIALEICTMAYELYQKTVWFLNLNVK